MKVEILNPDTVRNLYKNHGVFACTCYDTPEKYAERVGESCASDGHMSGSRCEYIKFRITGIDRGTAEQTLRHELGVAVPYEFQDNYSFAEYSELIKDISPDQIIKNMASFRYIDKNGFEWVTPKVIRFCPEAKEEYDNLMKTINTSREKIRDILIDNGVKNSVAVEAANFVLPRATTTSFVIGFTPEALIHYSHKRLCTRAQEFIRELTLLMKEAVNEISPKFANEMVPQCEHLLWCPEKKRCCGKMKTRDELIKELFVK